MKKLLTILLLWPGLAFTADLPPSAKVPEWAKDRPCRAAFEMDRNRNMGRPALTVRCAIYKGTEVLDKNGVRIRVEGERK